MGAKPSNCMKNALKASSPQQARIAYDNNVMPRPTLLTGEAPCQDAPKDAPKDSARPAPARSYADMPQVAHASNQSSMQPPEGNAVNALNGGSYSLGQAVLILRSSGAWTPGTVKGVSPEGITIEMEDGQKTIPLAAVSTLVKSQPGSKNFSNAVPCHQAPPCGSNNLLSMKELLAQQDMQLKHQGQPCTSAHPERPPMQESAQQPSFQELERQRLCRSVQPDMGSQQQEADMFALKRGLEFAAQNEAPSTQQPTAYQGQHQRQSVTPSRFAELPNTVPLANGVERLDPTVVHDLVRRGACVLVDVRSDDRACGVIDGAINVKAIDSTPFLAKVPGLVQAWSNQPLIVFHCQYSAHRAPQCANWYREQAASNQRVAIMDGGFRGWQSLGLPSVAMPSN